MKPYPNAGGWKYDLTPPQLPVTILDVYRANGSFEMNLPMADACPKCGAFRMRVGDYVCWGACFVCAVPKE